MVCDEPARKLRFFLVPHKWRLWLSPGKSFLDSLPSRPRNPKNMRYRWYVLVRTPAAWHRIAMRFKYPRNVSSGKQDITFLGFAFVFKAWDDMWWILWCFGLNLKSFSPFSSNLCAKCCHDINWRWKQSSKSFRGRSTNGRCILFRTVFSFFSGRRKLTHYIYRKMRFSVCPSSDFFPRSSLRFMFCEK